MDRDTEIARLEALLAEHEALLAEHEAVIAQRETELTAARHENQALRARAESAEEALARLQRDLERLRRQITGPSSERIVDPNQLPLPIGPDDAADDRQQEDADEPEHEDKKKRRKSRRGKRGGRRKISEMDHLRTLVHTRHVEDRSCPCGCGAQAQTIGFDVSWRLERIPAEMIRHKNEQEKVGFPHHDGADTGTVLTAPSPLSYALPKAMCGNRLLTQIVIDKYADHLPLHRQAERFRREGFDLARSTLCDWVMDLGELLEPITRRMELQVRAGTWLRADATGMPVMDRQRVKGRTHHGHLWAWGNYETVIFTYTPDKKAETVADLFKDFAGPLLIDGASDFNLVEKNEGVTRAGCWAHARRKLYEALSYDAVGALKGLAAIRQLFLAERIVMGAPIEERLALRDELCRPVLDGIRRWVDEELPKQVPRSPLHAALRYIDNQWSRLVVFLEHAEIACHNNDTERDLRRPVKGKHNYLFAGSPRGAHAAAVYYTLIGTCLLQGIDPKRYLTEILGRLDEPPSRLTPHAIREAWEDAATAAA